MWWFVDKSYTFIYIYIIIYNTFRSAALSTREQRASASAVAAATVRLTRADPPAGARAEQYCAMRCAPDRIIDILGRRASSLPREMPLSHRSLRVNFTEAMAHTRNHTHECIRIINVIIIIMLLPPPCCYIIIIVIIIARNPVLNARAQTPCSRPVRTDELFTIIICKRWRCLPQKDRCVIRICVRVCLLLIVVSKPRTSSSFGDFNNWFNALYFILLL